MKTNNIYYKFYPTTIIYSIFLTTLILLYFILTSNEFLHYFVFPIYFCGIIIGTDLIDWLRGKVETFDPVGFIGIFGYHFFFLAPLLFIYWDYGMSNVIEPQDWRPWIFGMGLINLIGLIVYKFIVKKHTYDFQSVKKYSTFWSINTKKLQIYTIPLLIIMFLLQTFVYAKFGGISGYVNSYVNRDGSFEGMGFIFMIAESFPILFLVLIINFWQSRNKKVTILSLIFVFLVFIILKLYFGGLRGSRSNTLWGIIWFVGIVHLFIKPIKRKTIILGTCFLFLFVFVYGVYKGSVGDGFDVFKEDSSLIEVAEEKNRGLDVVLLGDLSRTHVQAFILFRLIEHKEDYKYAYGRSYIGDVSILIPKIIYPGRQPTKVKEGTEIVLGEGKYNPNGYVSSRIYGLTGEFMLNFGYVLTPIVFVFFGIVLSKLRLFYFRLQSKDARLYLYPFLIVTMFLLLVQDLDNLVYSIVKNFLIPFIIIYFSTDKISKNELDCHK